MSKKKKIDLHNLTPEEELKYEIAEELGLLDRVMKDGWTQNILRDYYADKTFTPYF